MQRRLPLGSMGRRGQFGDGWMGVMEGHGYRSGGTWKAWGMSCATWKMKNPTLGGCRSVAMG